MVEVILQKAVENAVKAEELGISFYSGLARKFEKNQDLNQMFKLLAKDEAEHKKLFESLLANISSTQKPVKKQDKEFLDCIDISKYFEGMGTVDTSLTPTEVLTNAFHFEKETVLYYSGIRDIIGGSAELDEIIRVEKQHAMLLMKIITSESSFRGLSDSWD